ncbi:MAG TPA: MurR/RpiR family transcriptional regulator [Ignavibacteriaceae bacterium]|nr:MurR/RpiR family transcriptional regulator [Ignavibacteriaceae bacterium]
MRYKEVKEKITGSYESLPKNHQKIAHYIIENFDAIPFLNVHEISHATSSSVASIVRFAQRTGFSGYSELRDAITKSLKTQLTNKEIFPLFEKDKIEEDLLTSVANLDIKNINDTLNLIDRESFNNTVDLILISKKVYTAGLGISYLLAEILAYQLNQVAVNASTFKHSHTLFHEQILFLGKNDLIIAFSFPPYSKETVEAAKFACDKGIKVISITNKPASPITFYSAANLIVKSENMLFTNSFAAISVLINAVATQCALKNKAKAKKFLKETYDIAESQDQIIL